MKDVEAEEADWAEWDRQIERDSANGKLDRFFAKALADHAAGKSRALSDEECERLSAEEAEARYADFEAGRTKAIDGDEVFARARSRRRRTVS